MDVRVQGRRGVSWFVGKSRFLGGGRPSALDLFEGADGVAIINARAHRRQRLPAGGPTIGAGRRQPGRGFHSERDVVGLLANNGGVAEALRSFTGVGKKRIEVRWIPSALNRLVDTLYRWDPGDVRATELVVVSIAREHRVGKMVLRSLQMGDEQEIFGDPDFIGLRDERTMLWNPPFNFLPMFIGKVEVEGVRGVLLAPKWTENLSTCACGH